jgi:hypothetical protein
VSAAEAATITLTGVHNGDWRILVGQDAELLDGMVRAEPTLAYEASFVERLQGTSLSRLSR